MSTPTAIQKLFEAGTSVWLDDLSRDRIKTGALAEMISDKGVVGVTTNPSIFASAMSQGSSYDEQLKELAAAGTSVDEAVFAMATDDVRAACDEFAEVYRQTNGVDGRVSLEVDPRLARSHQATVEQAKQLAKTVDRDNLMIKIPATPECIPAIADVLSEGISVNVTLIFSVERYEQVIDAFIEGMDRAKKNGHDLSTIHSVASFFVSRVDTNVDSQLATLSDTAGINAMLGKAGIANAQLAYQTFTDKLVNNEKWAELAQAGAAVQRLLWASTSVKNSKYPDTLYVTNLAGPHTVNTMPEATLEATIAHGKVDGDTLTGQEKDARQVFKKLREAGIDLPKVWADLEDEGVEKFVTAWEKLLDALQKQLDQA